MNRDRDSILRNATSIDASLDEGRLRKRSGHEGGAASAYLRELGYSSTALAKAAGVVPSSASQYLNGKRGGIAGQRMRAQFQRVLWPHEYAHLMTLIPEWTPRKLGRKRKPKDELAVALSVKSEWRPAQERGEATVEPGVERSAWAGDE